MMRWSARLSRRSFRLPAVGLAAALCASLAACGGETSRTGPSNELLIVGYDREPDTMNRYATHILEDIEAGVVEGLVTNDEEMKIIPVLAAEIPTTENGGVIVRADGGMDVTWKLDRKRSCRERVSSPV